VVAQQADVLDGFRIAGVEVVWGGLGEQRVAGILCPNGDVLRSAVEDVAGRLLVIAVDQEQR